MNNNEQSHNTVTVPLTSHNMAFLVGERANYSVKLTQYKEINLDDADHLQEIMHKNRLANREEYVTKNQPLREAITSSGKLNGRKNRTYLDHTNMSTVSKTIGGSFKLGRIYSYAGVCSIESLAQIMHTESTDRLNMIIDLLEKALNNCKVSLEAEVRHLQMLYPTIGIHNENYLLEPFLDEPVIRVVSNWTSYESP